MKLWVDDIRPAPEGYKEVNSVNDAKWEIVYTENMYFSSNEDKYKL